MSLCNILKEGTLLLCVVIRVNGMNEWGARASAEFSRDLKHKNCPCELSFLFSLLWAAEIQTSGFFFMCRGSVITRIDIANLCAE